MKVQIFEAILRGGLGVDRERGDVVHDVSVLHREEVDALIHRRAQGPPPLDGALHRLHVAAAH